EGSTTMGPFAAIGVYDDLSPGQSCIPMRTAYHKLRCGVDMIGDVVGEQGLDLGRKLSLDFGNQYFYNVLLYLCQHWTFFIKVIVLGRYDNRINPLWDVFIIVFYRHLCFGVWTQIGDFTPIPS